MNTDDFIDLWRHHKNLLNKNVTTFVQKEKNFYMKNYRN